MNREKALYSCITALPGPRNCVKILNWHNGEYSELFKYTNRILPDTIFLDRGPPYCKISLAISNASPYRTRFGVGFFKK